MPSNPSRLEKSASCSVSQRVPFVMMVGVLEQVGRANAAGRRIEEGHLFLMRDLPDPADEAVVIGNGKKRGSSGTELWFTYQRAPIECPHHQQWSAISRISRRTSRR